MIMIDIVIISAFWLFCVSIGSKSGSKMHNHISIFDLFGDERELSYSQLVEAGNRLDITEIIVSLLIQHAVDNDFVTETETGFAIKKLPY
jgi:hypothetical protein